MNIDRVAFEKVVAEHHAKVFRTARRILRSDADAEDVTQQVFLRVLRGKVGAEALGWLAGRLAFNHLRAARRRRHHEGARADMQDGHGEGGFAAEEIAAVRALIDDLEAAERTAVVLRFQEGLELRAIAAVLGCATSTVHARLASALATLRRRLAGAGFALAAVELERGIAAAAPSSVVPAGLATKLAALPALGVASGASAKLVAAAALLLGGVGVVVALAASGRERGTGSGADERVAAATGALPEGRPEHGVAAQDPVRERVTSRPGEAGREKPPGAVTDATARLEGRVLAEGDAAPLADVRVVAECPELSSKGAPLRVEGRTDARGHFALVLPVRHRDGHEWILTVHRADWIGAFATARMTLRAEEARANLEARMRRHAADVPGEWVAEFRVQDGAGRAVPDVLVVVQRVLAASEGAPRTAREASAKSGADGKVTLRGTHHGEKRVLCLPFGKPFEPLEVAARFGDATPGPLDLVLPPDTPLAVRLVDARSGEPVRGVAVGAERDGANLAVGTSDERGSVVLRGLARRALELHGQAEGWSAFRVEGVVPKGEPVVVRMKRSDDPEPIGAYLREVHGVFVDRATRKRIELDGRHVMLWSVRPGDEEAREGVLVDAITPAPFQSSRHGEPPPAASAFHLSANADGRYVVLVRSPEHAPAALGPFDLVAGKLVSGLEVELDAGTEVEVRVTDERGQPVAGAWVWAARPSGEATQAARKRAEELARRSESGQRERQGAGVVTDVAGIARLRRVPAGVGFVVLGADAERRVGQSSVLRVAAREKEQRVSLAVGR